MTDLRYTEAPYDADADTPPTLSEILNTDRDLTAVFVGPSWFKDSDVKITFRGHYNALSRHLTFEQFDKIAAYVAALKRERGVD